MHMQKNSGFSLFELMITLVIISVLSLLCLPIYSRHITHARRLEAELSLIKLANAIEEYHIINNTYQNATLDALGFSEKIAHDQYQLAIPLATDFQYILKAIPQDKQAQNDTLCDSLILNSSGKREITGSGHLTDCW